MHEELRQNTPDTAEAAIRHLKHELHVRPHYGYAMLFLREYILGSQSQEKLKAMKYSIDEKHFLLQKYNEHREQLYKAAYGEWSKYVDLTNQVLLPEEADSTKTWVDVWEETSAAIRNEVFSRYPDAPDEEIPLPKAPIELDELQADHTRLSDIRACFE